MGKALTIVGLILLVIVASCVGCLYLGWQKATGPHDDFFKAVNSGDTARVMEQFHPKLREEIDEPVFAAWVKAVNEKLGAYEKLSPNGINVNMKTTDQGQEMRTEGTTIFEKGQAKALIRTIDGKIVGFNVESDEIGEDWLSELDHTFYDVKARAFLEAVREGKEETAWAMMDEALQADAGKDKWPELVKVLQAKLGAGELKLARHEFVPGNKAVLALWYEAGGPGKVKVVYRPQGLKMHLMAFSTE